MVIVLRPATLVRWAIACVAILHLLNLVAHVAHGFAPTRHEWWLALVDVDPTVLIPAAAIVFGGSLLLDNTAGSSAVFFPLAQIGGSPPGAGGELLVGVGAAVLGILGLINVAPVTLSLVALLALGVSTFLVGSAIGTKIISASR